MPPLPPAANVIASQLGFTDGSDNNVLTTLHWRYSGGPPSATDLNAISADIYNAARAFIPDLDSFSALTGVRCIDLGSLTGAEGEFADATPGTGGVDILPGATALLMRYVIDRRYRGGKPRSYFPFGVQTQLSTRQQWSTGFLTDVTAHYTTFKAAVLASTSGSTVLTDQVNVSYYDGFTVVTSPTTGRARNVPKRRTTPEVDTIVSFSASGTPATQRRRNK